MNSCTEFLWQAGYVGRTNEGAEYSLEREVFGGCIPWVLSHRHLCQGRRDFCPYLALIGSVMASVPDGHFLSARLILL